MALDNTKDTHTGALSSPPPDVDFARLINFCREAIIQVSLDGQAMFISPAAEQLLGWSAGRIAKNLGDLIHAPRPNSDVELLQDMLTGRAEPGCSPLQTEVQIKTALAPPIWVEANAHQLEDKCGNPLAFAVYLINIAKRKELESLLEAANQTDPLTGLVNRRVFEEHLKREWAIALREKTHTTLIKVSLDRFDRFADRYGARAAETCLARIAGTLKETARRPADITARIEEAEFALLLPRTHEWGAETISAYIQVAIQDLAIPNEDDETANGTLTVSVGVACAVAEQTGSSESSQFILAAADNCVYQARQEGGNCVKLVMNFLGR